MQIAVLGAGGAGMVSSWLLEQEHEVTLYEQDVRLGGHAHTVDVDVGGRLVGVDAGFEFFWSNRFPTVLRLLKLLDVGIRSYPARVTFEAVSEQTTVIPPLEDGGPLWSACSPGALLNLAGLAHAVLAGDSIQAAANPSTTVGEFLHTLHVPKRVRDEFLLPILLAGWCVDPHDFRTFLARDVLSYFPLQNPRLGWRPTHMEVEGGTRNYVQALARDLTRTTVRLSAPVVRAREADGRLDVRTTDGSSRTFDAVVIATNAAQAAEILRELPDASEACNALRRIRYCSTRIAIHGDLRWMPRNRRHWSVVNIRSDGRHSHMTTWKPWHGEPSIFKSWVTYASTLPDPLYSLVTYQHPWVDRAYFQTQQEIRAMQGQKGVWFAGMYTHDIDCHESAVQSAVRVARALSPKSSRLAALTNGGDA